MQFPGQYNIDRGEHILPFEKLEKEVIRPQARARWSLETYPRGEESPGLSCTEDSHTSLAERNNVYCLSQLGRRAIITYT